MNTPATPAQQGATLHSGYSERYIPLDTRPHRMCGDRPGMPGALTGRLPNPA